MKTEIGMYIRTNHRNEKVIRKIVNIFEDSKEHDHQLVFDKPTKYQYFIEDENYIPSYKLMDLIKKVMFYTLKVMMNIGQFRII